MTLTQAQQQAAYTLASVAVTAGAGTGKTHMLSERYRFHIAEQGLRPLQIVAVTFTEKAVAELKARIRSNLLGQMPGQATLMAELEAAPICTFHALCARICREHPQEAQVPPDFEILDDLESQVWWAEQLNRAMDKLPPEIYEKIPFTRLHDALSRFLADPLTARQALAHGSESWPAIISLERQLAETRLLKSRAWLDALIAVTEYAGQPEDALEQNRQTALAAMTAIEEGKEITPYLDAISGLSFRGGSVKNWPGGGFDIVKAALKALRDKVKEAQRKGLINLALGPVDEALASCLPLLKEAFEAVDTMIGEAKREKRMLDYADLEVHALRALENPAVCDYYARRWKAFLIDEFQDTNRVQAELLSRLCGQAIVTIVGDEKQSIYGFRRADLRCFQSFRERIAEAGGEAVSIALSFRTHRQLVEAMNSTFQPLLGSLFSPLEAARRETPHAGPHLRAYVLEADTSTRRAERLQAEARMIAGLVDGMLTSELPVFDKQLGSLRPIRPGDIGILSRTWQPLDCYVDALQTRGVPAMHAGGGSLLDTREAKDGVALVRFLADASDNLALAALLRSPFFAVSDQALQRFAAGLPRGTSWWACLRQMETVPPELQRAKAVLSEMLALRAVHPPSRLLQWMDRLTGYTAVIANLPNGLRREADWRGFCDLIGMLETGAADLFSVMRRLRQLMAQTVEIPRLPMEPDNAVSLMTIHAAKGLEWPIVIVPDLTRRSAPDNQPLRLHPELGVGLKLSMDEDDETLQKPAIYSILECRHREERHDELKRLLYVALTRARDQVILTAPDEKGEALELLRDGLAAADVPIEVVTLQSLDAQDDGKVPARQDAIAATLLQGTASSGLTELPVTAITEFATCPQRFRFAYIDGHPGLQSLVGESAFAARVGSLVHQALELDLRELKALRALDPDLPLGAVKEALQLIEDFDTCEAFAPFRKPYFQREVPISLDIAAAGQKLYLNGVIDLMGDDFVLDYKSDREMAPEHHRLQLWAYARATGRKQAHIAYIRHGQVHTFSPSDLSAAESEATAIACSILSGQFQPAPDARHCSFCPYHAICEDKA